MPNIVKVAGHSYGERSEVIKYIIIHHTKVDLDTTLKLFTIAGMPNAHYVIDKDGAIYNLLPEEHIAHHAGQQENSRWEGDSHLNRNSIGIELVNNGCELFPEKQIASLIWLAQDIMPRYNIAPYYVLGHSDIAPTRKDDPGAHFPWQRLAEAGVGLYPTVSIDIVSGAAVLACLGDEGEKVQEFQQGLAEYGYPIEVSGRFDATTIVNVVAFRKHFVPYDLSPIWNQACEWQLKSLLEVKRQQLIARNKTIEQSSTF